MAGSHQKPILYLTRQQLWVIRGEDKKSFAWDRQHTTELFAQIKKTFRLNHAFLVFGNELAYLFAREAPSASVTDQSVLQLAQSYIPEQVQLESLLWRSFSPPSAKNSTKPFLEIGTIAPTLIQTITQAVQANQLAIDYGVLFPALLAHQTKTVQTPHIILWSDIEQLAIITWQGVVYFVHDLSRQPQQKITDIIERAKVLFGNSIDSFLLSSSALPAVSFPPGWKMIQQPLHPYRDIDHLKPDNTPPTTCIKLRVIPAYASPEKTEISPQESPSLVSPDNSSGKKRWKSILATLFLLGAVGAGGFVAWKTIVNQTTEESVPETAQSSPTPLPASPTPTMTPQPTQQVSVNTGSMQVQILNASGIAGEAAAIERLIRSLGFEEVTTGNADSPSVTTLLQTKADIPQPLVNQLEELLSDYEPETVETLLDEDKYDIVIIVGRKN